MGFNSINTRIKLYCFLLFAFCLSPVFVFSQQPLVQTFVDKTDILIGEQVQYKVKASFPSAGFKVNWFTLPDSVAHFEIVDRSKIDTSSENNNTILEQTITLTSFDSGRWNTPALPINFNPERGDTTINLFTDSVAVNVGYAPADSTNQLRDIKPILEVTITNYLWYYIGGGILLLLVLAFILWKYFKNKKKNPSPGFSSRLSPYDEAMQALEQLKTLDLQKPDALKQFHSKLAEIFKWYISRKQRISILNKTTGDVLVLLTENNLSKDTITSTATALRCGDAVKFAKFLPAPAQNEECFNKIKDLINTIHTNKPINQ